MKCSGITKSGRDKLCPLVSERHEEKERFRQRKELEQCGTEVWTMCPVTVGMEGIPVV